ncbi:hypothetical protein SKAU_G00053270 [Synaphobranchus kaupii]|uniref:Hermes trasposase DNA-binding domain-containing protein n=1 Tax=Synaphobranchus kaupii TaxID=118154 RepID=A0A9Q1JA00_SYNKA|nr:hypothetical protein SKAU_G00053270 [Synaphobranchus kaupii]
MCSQDLRPFAMVEGQGFINVAQELLDIGSKYGGSILAEDVLPCARTVSRHVEGEYDKVKSDVVEELKQAKWLCAGALHNCLVTPTYTMSTNVTNGNVMFCKKKSLIITVPLPEIADRFTSQSNPGQGFLGAQDQRYAIKSHDNRAIKTGLIKAGSCTSANRAGAQLYLGVCARVKRLCRARLRFIRSFRNSSGEFRGELRGEFRGDIPGEPLGDAPVDLGFSLMGWFPVGESCFSKSSRTFSLMASRVSGSRPLNADLICPALCHTGLLKVSGESFPASLGETLP